MEWQRYYENLQIIPFLNQAPYYFYLLESFGSGIDDYLPETQTINLLLGGIHPLHTHPDHLTYLGRHLFPKHPLSTAVVDFNKQALDRIPGEGFVKIHSPLESLPQTLPPIHLLTLDFTLDFMNDAAIRRFNQTLPDRLDPLGVIATANCEPILASIQQSWNQKEFGLPYYCRSHEALTALLTNFKPIEIGSTDDSSRITIWAMNNHPYPRFSDSARCLYVSDDCRFSRWFFQQPYFSTPLQRVEIKP